MRLGLEPSSPRMPPRTHALTLSSPSARASAAFPIDVDASGDEAEPQGQAPHNAQVTITPAVYTPLLLSPSRHRTAEPKPTAYESSDESDAAEEKESEPQQTQPQSPAQKPSLNFFFNVNERGNTPRKQRAESIGSSISASSSTGSSRQEDSQKVTAARTCVCGEKFDRCDLDFRADRVKLTIWKKTKRQWKGFVEYAHLVRFCFADVDKPPYILLMQLDGSRGRSDFASFYDSIFAKVCSENSTKEHATPQIFGVVLYFDEPMDYIRCQSMADINKRLAVLFAKPLT
ncbi:hypothetical protein PHYBOEH_009612 [Phytophthora boehmeriae]|uniref:Uncharacterized protein n=1 Tax=Phytophthora boehmeriae TaxID=109152 RepID=A0A8T1WYM0_9STRA|nr:hypothetical protein PHYBOEH_009612 [Phytophthora boehmeriae]